MTVFASDSIRLWGLVGKEYWRRFKQRVRAGPLYRWRFSVRAPDRILIAPPDLRYADPVIAEQIYAGRFTLAGQVADIYGSSPFSMAPPSVEWHRALHGFRWLRHLREAGSDLAAANARALVSDWLDACDKTLEEPAWDPGITARRIISWLQHSSIILQGSELPFYRAFLRSLSAQIRFLRTMAPEMPEDEQRLRARIAICLAALSLPTSPGALRSASRNLGRELDHQILADGGHVSRNPEVLLELLADLLPLRQTYTTQAKEPPPALLGAIDRMIPALRFFRHEDGNLARFNGVGPTIPDRIMRILRHDEIAGAPLLNASHSGFNRLSMGRTTVIADTGNPPPYPLSRMAHAGTLSFELSSGRHCYIVNSGADTLGPDDFRPLARSTAAHSTATLNNTSSGRFATTGWINQTIGSPIHDGPRNVVCDRMDGDGSQSFVASHDGYMGPFGLLHERKLTLREYGSVLHGVDRFHRPKGTAAPAGGRHEAILRFHLHPDVHPILDGDGRLMLMTDQGDSWTFTCENIAPAMEESIYFAGLLGPWKSRQIVLVYDPGEFPQIDWYFTRTGLGLWSLE